MAEMSKSNMSLFTEMFSEKLGKIDAVLEHTKGLSTGHGRADFCLEAVDLIGERYVCQALYTRNEDTRTWRVDISSVVGNRATLFESFLVHFKDGCCLSQIHLD